MRWCHALASFCGAGTPALVVEPVALMGVGSVGGVQRHVVRAGLVGAKGVLVCHAWRCLCLLQLCLLRLPHTLRVFLSVFLFFCCCAAPNVDCQQSTWSDWSVCSAACGGGTRSRHRETIAPASGTGAPCGALSETQACNELVCHNGTRRGQGVWMCVAVCPPPCVHVLYVAVFVWSVCVYVRVFAFRVACSINTRG